ncbi:MAG: cytochrome c3 family protein [Planctomycetota bacterium]|jgi:hypothetical protein
MKAPRTWFLLLAALLSCALITMAGTIGNDKELTPFPHAIHMEYEMVCTDCHGGALDQDRATLPKAGVCFECHEALDPEWDPPELIAFFEERSRGEDELYFSDSLEIADLKFSHKIHAARGTECSDCHGPVADDRPIQGGDPDFKHSCLDCHKTMNIGTECKLCHDSNRDDKPPASHESKEFIRIHGLNAPEQYRKLPEGRCFYCHEKEQCEQCHLQNKPEWHLRPFFPQRHGVSVRQNQMSMNEAGCALCHDASGCKACHLQKQPRSHSITFKNRTHGMLVRLDREQCRVCHQQSFCIHCHTTKEPVSHRGQFRRGRQIHCFNCHLPLQDNGCWACHKSTPGHFTLPMPSDAAHMAATPDTCRGCHTTMTHVDNGLDCTICH